MKKKRESIRKNFIQVFSNYKYIIIFLTTMIITGTIFYIFTNSVIIKGNYGLTHYYMQISLQTLIVLLFSIFVPASIYKFVNYSKFSLKENSTSAIGTFLGIIVAGCPACSITLASYIGLAGIIAMLPYDGLELKIIAVPLLLYAVYSVLINLNTCKLKK